MSRRPSRRDEFTLDHAGFALVDHRSVVTDFADASVLDGVGGRIGGAHPRESVELRTVAFFYDGP
jgi:hypothetical protein